MARSRSKRPASNKMTVAEEQDGASEAEGLSDNGASDSLEQANPSMFIRNGSDSEVDDEAVDNISENDTSGESTFDEEESVDEDSDQDVPDMNTTGTTPLEWYDGFDHRGYDRAGIKLTKEAGMDEVEKLLASRDDPNYRRTVYDARNDESTVLTDRELTLVRRMLRSKFPRPEFNAEPDYVDFFSKHKRQTPLSSTHEPKRRFVPSKWERMKVLKLVRGIKEGRIRVGPPPPPKPRFFMLWGEDGAVADGDRRGRKAPPRISAPKLKPPGHVESYHPPPEFLLNDEERKAWEEADPSEREQRFLPRDFGVLRRVPGYHDFVKERFERCLDLYLCTRTEKQRLNIDPESLVPKLPRPCELRPFPTRMAVAYLGHSGRVRSLAVDPLGAWLATGGDDGVVRLWEVDTGRCVRKWEPSRICGTSSSTATDDVLNDGALGSMASSAIVRLCWNPNPQLHVLAVAFGRNIMLLYTGTAASCAEDIVATRRLLDVEASAIQESRKPDVAPEEKVEEQDCKEAKAGHAELVRWTNPGGSVPSASALAEGASASVMLSFTDPHIRGVVDITWHSKGEYLASVCATASTQRGQVCMHHVGRRQSQNPFAGKLKGDVQRVAFHPSKPILFTATKTHVLVYHLVRQTLLKKLSSGVKWISSIGVHPSGDHVVVGSFDRRVCWFDLDLSSKPYKTLKYHDRAVRQSSFHQTYPLMASASDDGAIHIFHARVYDDLMHNALIVPVKSLKAHALVNGLGVLDCAWHPSQPWVFSAGADGIVRLWQNVHGTAT